MVTISGNHLRLSADKMELFFYKTIYDESFLHK
jgi:hypothetical protein